MQKKQNEPKPNKQNEPKPNKQNEPKLNKKNQPDDVAKKQREVEQFKRKYFDFYDDIKISVKEDW